MDLERRRSLEEARAFAASPAPGAALRAGGLRAHRADAAAVCLLAPGQGGEGAAEALPGAQHGVVAAAGGAVAEALPGARRDGRPARKRYRREDIVQLAETDELHGRLSGSAAWALLLRAGEVFGDMRCERLAGLSNGHLPQPATAARLCAPDGAQDDGAGGADRRKPRAQPPGSAPRLRNTTRPSSMTGFMERKEALHAWIVHLARQ